MMKILKLIGWAALGSLLLIQFIRPEKNSTNNKNYVLAFEQETQPSAQVKAILSSTCYDCHSNNTQYPWYNNISPVNYWLDHHIEEGKEHLNFSDWANYSAKRKEHKLHEIIEEVEEDEMPLPSYTITHKEARLTPEQKKMLMAWAQKTRAQYQVALQQD